MIVFNQALATNSANRNAMASQYAAVNAHRDDARHALPIAMFNALSVNAQKEVIRRMTGNAGANPFDLYREFDRTTVQQFQLDEGDNILNRIMPLARSLPVGRTVFEGARASDAGHFQSSMSGELSVVYDNVDYSGQKAIIPIHQNGFKRNWREGEQLSLEQFDDAIIQSAQADRRHRNGLIDYMLDGDAGVTADGVSWLGMRNDPTVHQVDLGAGGLNIDFTSDTVTGADVRDAWIQLRDELKLTNKVTVPATYFVSNEIMSNFERYYSDNYASGTILDHLKRVGLVADIVESSKLTGNQVMAIPLNQNYFMPLVGMAVSTIALPRPAYNSPFAFDKVSAVGFQVINDFDGENKGAMYAAG